MLKRIFGNSSDAFRTRSPERDRITDERSVLTVSEAIDLALRNAESEHAGLKRRLDHVISLAAIVGGNAIEDVQMQSDPRAELLQKSDGEIRHGEERLRHLESHIAKLRLLRGDLRMRFPEFSDTVMLP